MSLDKETALKAVYAAIDEINMDLEEDQRFEKSAEAVFFGPDREMDSILLVNLVSATEQHLYDLAGEEILLASEAAMSRRRSPYRSAQTLAEYAVEVASGTADGQ